MAKEASQEHASEQREDDRAPRSKAPRRMPRWAQALLGVAAGLALAEGLFWLRDGGAFPHINAYTADPELGVRLLPGASQRVSFGGNPVTSVRINASGFRGEDWPPPGDGRDAILVVGDSHVFGLGVEEHETFAAAFEREAREAGGPRVLNAGVPTWGPVEYSRILKDLVPARRPKTVIYAVNFVNDAFEAARPNTERHAVWDGWAVRRETAPASVTSFPGRDLLFRHSHAFFALRQLLYKRGPERDDRGFASEGTWKDLVGLGADHATQASYAESETERRGRLHEARARFAERAALAAELRVKLLAYSALKLDPESTGVYLSSHANPGDIVLPQLGEEGRPLAASVKYIQQAAEMRTRFEERLRALADEQAGSDSAKEIKSSIEERDALEAKLTQVLAEPVEIVRAGNPLLGAIEEAKATVEAAGARLVVLVLPLDVQVSPEEWKKYGREPIDMAGTQVLIEDLVAGARDRGVSAIDATAALREVEPGAYLNGDPHMSPSGHLAVAKALAQALREPPPKPKVEPRVALPPGRSRLPQPKEWTTQAGEVLVTGSDAAGCSTRRIREWLYVRCTARSPRDPAPIGAVINQGGHGEASVWATEGAVTMVAPTVRGDELKATFFWKGKARKLVVRWPAGEVVPTMGFEEADPGAAPPEATASERAAIDAACACAGQLDPKRSCGELIGSPDEDCARTYKGDCAKLIECIEGRPTRPPRCAPGSVNAGAALHCYAVCDDPAACPEGRACVEKQGAKLCLQKAAAEGSTFAPPTGVAASQPAIAKPAAAPSDDQTKRFDAGARKALDAIQKALESCKLEYQEPGDWFVFDFFDWCRWKEGDVPAVSDAVAAVDALVKEAPELEQSKRADALAKLRLFREWIELSGRSKQSRGTLALFQEVAAAWNAYQPDKALHVAPDPPHIVRQYTEDFGHPHVNYISRSYGEFEARKKLGLPLPWRRGLHGPRLPSK